MLMHPTVNLRPHQNSMIWPCQEMVDVAAVGSLLGEMIRSPLHGCRSHRGPEMYHIVPVTLQLVMVLHDKPSLFEICLSSLDNAHFPLSTASEGSYNNFPVSEKYNINLQTLQSIVYNPFIRTFWLLKSCKDPRRASTHEVARLRIGRVFHRKRPSTVLYSVCARLPGGPRKEKLNVFQAGPSYGAVSQGLLSQSRVSLEGKPYRIREPRCIPFPYAIA